MGKVLRKRLNLITKLFLTVVIVAIPYMVSAQLCTGSLGDPVVDIDFGSGTSLFGGELTNGITTYSYKAQSFPNDGSYTIENTTAGAGNVWWSATDHTGDSGGYMMVVNASTSLTDYFYKQTVSGLCENTTYEFAAWMMNLLRSSDINPPNVTFTIERTTGEILGTYTTGTIPKAGSAIWTQFGFFFKTPAGVTDVVIRMKNNSPGGAPANDLALDDITFRACGPVINASIDVAGSPTTLNICAGNSTSYKLQATVSAGYSAPNYQWQVNANGLGWNDVTGATSIAMILNETAAGTYQYRLSVGDGALSANCRIVSDLITITVKDASEAIALNSGPLCVTDQLTLNASGGVSYLWSGPGGYTSTAQAPVIENVSLTQAGLYTVIVTTDEGCTATASTTVVIGSRPVAKVSDNVSVCEGTATILHASGGQSYVWSPSAGLSDPSIGNPIANPLITTTYTVSVTDNAYSCPSIATVTVSVLKGAVANAGPDKTTVKGNSVQLDGSVSGTDVSYYWTPVDYLNDASLLKPTAVPEKNITYTLHAISGTGCTSTVDQMNITVYGKIVIPNTFSPNGDGINDVWNVAALDTYANASVSIFNRYGSLVYKSAGYTNPWNGTRNGEQLPVGTYYYLIDLKNNTPVLSGWIWLTR